MLCRCFMRDDYSNAMRDAFWIEATQEEAETGVFPRLQPDAIAKSKELAERFKQLAEQMGNPSRPFCFLVVRDLSSIDPFHVHYPFHQLWNGYSPFERMPEKVIANLEELRSLVLPAKKD